jgi:hypothetical protein
MTWRVDFIDARLCHPLLLALELRPGARISSCNVRIEVELHPLHLDV